MICLSSIRPFAKSAVYRVNALRAKASWEKIFERIFYFAEPEQELCSPKTEWVSSSDWPLIRDMAHFASKRKPIAAIVNSDIVLSERFALLEPCMNASAISALTSRRYDLESGMLLPDDRGRDVFVAKPHVWRWVAKEVPECLRIGHHQWDSWMISFLRKELNTGFADFTRAKWVFHPKHEERHMPYNDQIAGSRNWEYYWSGRPDTQIGDTRESKRMATERRANNMGKRTLPI